MCMHTNSDNILKNTEKYFNERVEFIAQKAS